MLISDRQIFGLQVLFLLFLGHVGAVIFALDFFHELLHLFDLPIPLISAHLCLATEKLVVRLAVALSESIPESGELTVVVIEVKMVHSVASRPVDDGAVSDVFTVMNQDGPDVDCHEEENVGELLKREDKGENVVWQALHPAIYRMEGMRCVRAGHNPLVVRLV